eukprot:jgi/Botrbrau1/16896/Bobra.0265s0002.1
MKEVQGYPAAGPLQHQQSGRAPRGGSRGFRTLLVLMATVLVAVFGLYNFSPYCSLRVREAGLAWLPPRHGGERYTWESAFGLPAAQAASEALRYNDQAAGEMDSSGPSPQDQNPGSPFQEREPIQEMVGSRNIPLPGNSPSNTSAAATRAEPVSDDWLEDEMIVPPGEPGTQTPPSGQLGAENVSVAFPHASGRELDQATLQDEATGTEATEDAWIRHSPHVNHMTEEDIQALLDDDYDYEDDHEVLLTKPEPIILSNERKLHNLKTPSPSGISLGLHKRRRRRRRKRKERITATQAKGLIRHSP